jgi:chromosomal replication initiator protein
MHAIWHAIRERDPKTRVLYLTAESFVNRFITALRTKNTGQFKELFRNVDVLMVDDVPVHLRQGGKPGRVLLHLQQPGRAEQADRAVLGEAAVELQDIEERMRSRLGSGLSPTSIPRPTSCGCRSCRPRPRARACRCR